MNILVIGKFYTEGFALHIAETLSAMGHAVRRFEPGYQSNRIGGRIGHRIDQVRGLIHSSTDNLPAIRGRRMRSLWETADLGPLDVTIVCHDFLWPAEVAELKRRTGTVVAMWFPDALVNFGRGFFMTAPYDAVFFKDPYIIKALNGIITPTAYYLPEAFNPAKHCLLPEDSNLDAYKCDITTAGNQHSYRVSLFKHLAEYDVKLWGPPAPLWMETGPVAAMYQGRSVLNHEKAKAFLGAKIVINTIHYGEILGLNVRAFETAGIGAFQLVDWRPGLDSLFEDGKELVAFSGIDDLKKKISFWLPREEERHKIAESGRQRAYKDHTYQMRLNLLLDSMSGKAKGFSVSVAPDNNYS